MTPSLTIRLHTNDDVLIATQQLLPGAANGKAMIVCMSRRICVDLYDLVIRLRPKWDS